MMDLQAQYHFAITADKRIERWDSITDKLTQLINRMNPTIKTMQLIHIKNLEEFNVVVKTLELTRGFKPYRAEPLIKGDRYISVEDKFLAYFLSDGFVRDNPDKIISFDQFIKEAI